MTLTYKFFFSNFKIDAIPIIGEWCEIDTEEDLEIAKKKFIG